MRAAVRPGWPQRNPGLTATSGPKDGLTVQVEVFLFMRKSSLVLSACVLLATAAATLPGSAQTTGGQTTGAQTTRHISRKSPAAHASAPTHLPPLTEDERAEQMLNRFTFGPRPGDLAAVRAMGGPDAWFERQLSPEKIDDVALNQRLAQYPALALPTDQLLYNFPSVQDIRQVAAGKRPIPADPLLAGLYQTLITKYDDKQKQDKSTAAGSTSAMAPIQPAAAQSATGQPPKTPSAAEPTDAEMKAGKKRDAAAAGRLVAPIFELPKTDRMAAIMKLPVEDRITLTAGLAEPQRSTLLNDFTPRERDLFNEMGGGPNATGAVANELQQAKVLRAVLSERQLEEVMTDFWFNHFNVFLRKNQDTYYTASYERDAIRPHALGKFRDLLLATAQHPAMLVYLDNWQSIGPDSLAANIAANRAQNRVKISAKGGQRGLNENYGREVMELHTVGVNGGYTQGDVTALSKILTGWTIDRPDDGGGFVFDPRRHEPGAKQWFGQTVHENGLAEGEQALAYLASRPQTAHFISYKLAQRFVADDPPSALVDRMAQTFLASDGDIRQVLRIMVHSPEFNARANYRNKIKTPLEFVASAFRATGTDPSNPGAVVGLLNRMGEPLYGMQPPTGYPMTADHWMNSAALVDRLNFSLQLANSHFANIHFDAPRLLAAGLLSRGVVAGPSQPTPQASVARTVALSQSSPALASVAPQPELGEDEALNLLQQILTGGTLSPKTDAVIRQQLAAQQTTPAADPGVTLDTMTALILGSPEFQVR